MVGIREMGDAAAFVCDLLMTCTIECFAARFSPWKRCVRRRFFAVKLLCEEFDLLVMSDAKNKTEGSDSKTTTTISTMQLPIRSRRR